MRCRCRRKPKGERGTGRREARNERRTGGFAEADRARTTDSTASLRRSAAGTRRPSFSCISCISWFHKPRGVDRLHAGSRRPARERWWAQRSHATCFNAAKGWNHEIHETHENRAHRPGEWTRHGAPRMGTFLVSCLTNGWYFAARDFRVQRGASDEQTRRGL